MEKSAKIILAAGLAAALSVGSFAAGSLITISVDPTVKIKVNGEEFKPKDANGNDVMTFIYNGTTYAPLRALAEAYGLQVGYDAGANMATVDDPNAGLYFDNWEPEVPENVILWDDQYVTITYSRCYYEDSWFGSGYNVEFIAENKTDVEITFQMDTIALNGFSYSVGGSENVAAHSKGYISFYAEDTLPVSGIETISGKIKVIDFSDTLDMGSEWSYSYDAAFSDVRVN